MSDIPEETGRGPGTAGQRSPTGELLTKELMQCQDFSLEPSATLEDTGDDLLCVPHLLGATRSLKIRYEEVPKLEHPERLFGHVVRWTAVCPEIKGQSKYQSPKLAK